MYRKDSNEQMSIPLKYKKKDHFPLENESYVD